MTISPAAVPTTLAERLRQSSIWLFAFGYFACYVPYSAMTKALSSGLAHGMSRTIPGMELLPLSTLASAVSMIALFSLLGWWKHAGRRTLLGVSVPCPTIWTFLSGLSTAAIIVTTTLAYTFRGVSIPFMMLLMRGGVLLLAPVVDWLSGRKVRWFSWVALALSFAALADALTVGGGLSLPLLCAVDIFFYLLGYFVRLRFMSHLAKSKDRQLARRYFVEEQMIAAPASVVALAVLAAIGTGPLLAIRRGFLEIPFHSHAWWVVVIGVLSQGTGFFGGLVLLDASENTFCVPLNRASSVLAGILAALALASLYGQRGPTSFELVGAGLLVLAIGVLWAGPRLGASARS